MTSTVRPSSARPGAKPRPRGSGWYSATAIRWTRAFRVFPAHPALEPPTFAELAEAVYGPLLDALEPAS